jgi:hypothetical protein
MQRGSQLHPFQQKFVLRFTEFSLQRFVRFIESCACVLLGLQFSFKVCSHDLLLFLVTLVDLRSIVCHLFPNRALILMLYLLYRLLLLQAYCTGKFLMCSFFHC